MATPLWSPGEYITPGDLRQPRSGNPVVPNQLTNNDLEGAGGWTFSDPGLAIVADGRAYDGANVIQHANTLFGVHTFTNDNVVPVVPGQVINAQLFYLRETNVTGRQGVTLSIDWFDSGMVLLGDSRTAELSSGAVNIWYGLGLAATAPEDAAFAQLKIYSRNNNTGGPHAQLFDQFSWDYIQPVAQAGLVYKAVQANAGFTAATEPVWPLTLGLTVVDNEVTWEAVLASNVTWQAIPIMKSGTVEPTWPVEVGANILDGTVNWLATDRRIQDENCPNGKAVTIAASKIFAGDRDIIRFSATINPKDWTTANDAGYLPFGLQAYGSNDVAALGLYRSNLVGFNSQGFQMWQVDQDPANMAFLDAVPVGCTFPHTIQPVANDLLMLTAVGARNISIAGASTNLQAEGVGEPIDKIVKAKIKLLTSDDNVLSIYWPAAGQYWLIFGTEAFILSINGAKKKSWSRYVFPDAITDFTLDGNTLVLRAGVKVWEVDEDTVYDDYSAAVDGDPYYDDVVWLMHGEGTDGGTVFTDSSSYARTVSTTGDAETDTAQQKFGVSSIRTGSGGYVSAVSAAELDLSTERYWTVEGWFRGTNGRTGTVIYKNNFTSLYPLQLSAGTTGSATGFTANGAVPVTGATAFTLTGEVAVPDGTWVHFAVVRDNSTFRLFVNGAQLSTATYSGDLAENLAAIRVMDGGTEDGWLDEFRWTKGVARYTADFTVPAAAFPDVQSSPASGTDIIGVIQWPYLDMGAIGREKGLVGIDLVCDAPTGVSVSIGYNQNDRTQRTTDYEVDPDTLTGKLVPFPVSGPSFDLKLTFAAGQQWEWFAANLYVNDWRQTS